MKNPSFTNLSFPESTGPAFKQQEVDGRCAAERGLEEREESGEEEGKRKKEGEEDGYDFSPL